MNVNVCLVPLPERIWRSWPQDRSLAELAKDALAMERLISKGVDISKQQARYVQMCRRLQSLAIQHLGAHGLDGCVRWQGREAEAYLRLIEYLQTLEESGKIKPQTTRNNEQYIPRTSNSIGKSFYQPGTDVENQWHFFYSIKTQYEEITILAHKKAEFYQQAYRKGAAVIEVVTFK